MWIYANSIFHILHFLAAWKTSRFLLPCTLSLFSLFCILHCVSFSHHMNKELVFVSLLLFLNGFRFKIKSENVYVFLLPSGLMVLTNIMLLYVEETKKRMVEENEAEQSEERSAL